MTTLALTKTEQEVLYRKYKESGMSPEDAIELLRKVKTHLRDLVREMQMQNKDEKDINLKFQEEFQKLIMQAEN